MPMFQDRYDVKRGSFSEVTDKDVAHFESIFGNESARIVTDESEKYNIDFMRSVRGILRFFYIAFLKLRLKLSIDL